MFINDSVTILWTYFTSLFLQYVSWPLIKRVYTKLPDQGWALSRITTSLLVSLVVWETGNLGLEVNTSFFMWTVFLVIFLINVYISGGKLSSFFGINKESMKLIVLEEYLFIVGLVVLSLTRSYLPNIDSLEKFMDFGFINRYLVSSKLPVEDMWQAGSIINYYSFGHFWASQLIRTFGVTASIGYNLVLGFIGGVSLSVAFLLSYIFSKSKDERSGLVGGVIGAFSVVLAGNSHIIWYLLKNLTLKGYWYADATRFIHNTIHEFPGYSFVVADLHGHLLDLPVVLGLLVVIYNWSQNRGRAQEVIIGVLFGIMMMTNTWDVAIYGLLMLVLGLFLLTNKKRGFIELIISALVISATMAITTLPWWMSFQSISSGIYWVKERSPIWQLAVLWTGGISVSLLTNLFDKKNEENIWSKVMLLMVLLLIAIPEFVFAKDIYPDHPRANTMFKLTYQASVLIGLLSGSLWGKILDSEKQSNKILRWSATFIGGVFFCGSMLFPVQSFTNFYGNFENYRGLDGEKWILLSKPDNSMAIDFLRKNNNSTNLVEAVGDSYTTFNMISVFTGIPTIQGWRVHEWLWRGGYGPVAEREAEVKEVYEGISVNKSLDIIKKYRIGWILVGDDEVKTYKVNHKKLSSLGKKVWEGENTYIIKIN